MNKFYSTEKEILAWLKENMGLNNNPTFTFVEDEVYGLVVDVKGNLSFYAQHHSFIPVKFNFVDGILDFSHNKLTSLDFAPREITRKFNVSHNLLASLKGSPKIAEYFECSYNKLTSLEGGPDEVPEEYDCSHNLLSSLKGSPMEVGDLICSHNNLSSLQYSPKKCRAIEANSNNIQTLEFIPSFVEDGVFLHDNPLLSIQTSSDNWVTYDELVIYSNAFKEKKLLENIIVPTLKSNSINKL